MSYDSLLFSLDFTLTWELNDVNGQDLFNDENAFINSTSMKYITFEGGVVSEIWTNFI